MGRTATPLLIDATLAVGLTGLTVVTYLALEDGSLDVLAISLAVLSVGPIALRQVAPVVTMLVMSGALAAYALLGYGDYPSGAVGIVVGMFTVATLCTRWVAASVFPLTIVVSVLAYVTGEGVLLSQVVQAGIVCLSAWALGSSTARWSRAAERAAADAERAVTGERVRIARELHDVVTHHMSVVSLQTGLAGYVLDSDPATARTALGHAGAAGRDALHEMRRMLDALRLGETGPLDAAAIYAPQPGLADIDALAERMCASGLSVTITRAPGKYPPLPTGLELCAYRVVQESLTNALRHAGPASARVLIEPGEDVLTVRVDDDGTRPTKPLGRGAGHGLRGMRERAELYGGVLDAGPAAGGGWSVELRLPMPASTPRSNTR